MVGFEDLVRRSWEGDGTGQGCTMDRISRCRRKIMEWKKKANLNSREKIVRLLSDLMVLNSSVWDTRKLQELFVDEDIPLILQGEATMIGLVWTTEALNDIQVRRIILETSSPQVQKNFSQASLPWSLNSLWKRFRRALDRFETYRVVRINDGCNTIAQNIAESALQVQWQQSYLARNGPEWLDGRINMEASVV
ncbi:hypothetical protein HID58_033513, partial [Brassica napus]